ncbi:DUF2490 domain-containing protein [Allomuricauda sp. SCSIO 65647]|uniref:DUF2490 domain-containing protein n=1 Tax=Allomuricauda sp. SCSIO 65647 TaxID=2908843 RepID=UPI001F40C760|nr:DUF2490 domain-containing protein [Muricauda sp. SCSIO 65647]UJH66159.1 DUF2490 domain-containing protein [Muricauda sp. SCSIO 65647]
MFCTRLFWPFLFLGCLLTQAQENFTGYFQPQVALNYDVTPFYSHNFSVQNRNYFYEDEESRLQVRQLDLSHFSNLKIRDNQSMAFGIMYRFRENFDDGPNELRFTQQYNITQKKFVVRYGHRFRTEQRITDVLTTHRFRYRFSIDFPLLGERIDIGEPYLVGNLETLLSLAKSQQPQYDQRLTLNLGWLLNKETKLQVGTEYRFEDFTAETENVLFFLTTLNFSL